MEVTIKCDCGNEETAKADMSRRWCDIDLTNFFITGYDDGNAYVKCKKCEHISDF